MQPHFFIIYDGIANTVFTSQVLNPLLAKLEQNPDLIVHLVSFEKNLSQPLPSFHPRLIVHIIRKIPFFGTVSLLPAVRSLHALLSHHPLYTLTARGPLAGFIALCARRARCMQFTIQARGLAAQEYRYSTQHASFPLRHVHALRSSWYEALERRVFSERAPNFTIQAVSPALKKYLVDQFGTHESSITIATHDMPAPVEPAQRSAWRTARRAELGIPFDARVYCYSGSAHAWQCPEKVFSFFTEQYAQDPHAILLILTTDPAAFASYAAHYQISPHALLILAVRPDDVLSYLCASDVGLLFREPHIINWVSRPTKMLEYKAAGLTIEHNNTVALLHKTPISKEPHV